MSVLNMYSSLRTAMSMAAYAAQVAQQGLFVSPGTQNSNEASFGFMPGALQGATLFGATLGNFKLVLATDTYKHIDASSFALKFPIGACRQWLAAAAVFHDRSCEDIRLTTEKLHESSSALEQATPRWPVLFAGGSMDKALAKSRILGNPSRPLLRPTMQFLQAIREDIVTVMSAWGIDHPPALHSEIAFSSNAHAAAEDLLIVTAAVNTLLHSRDKKTTAVMANEVLTIAKQRPEFMIPEVLRLHLEAAAETVSASTGSAASDVTRAATVKSEVAEAGAARATANAPPPAAHPASSRTATASGPSSSTPSRSCGVKREPEPSSGPSKRRRKGGLIAAMRDMATSGNSAT